ncbi:hypothetical protein [Rivularia sp. UHCC 0363]|nr:hypothetical protein [Rivularia sp. UHCC 0363]MEA5595911.1 hypothetical protein [Rivularia sp. UHCC 0363]
MAIGEADTEGVSHWFSQNRVAPILMTGEAATTMTRIMSDIQFKF